MSQDLDLDNLNMLKDLLGDRFTELVETYLSDSVARMTALKAALESGDMSAASHEAHGLKGSSRNIGANPLGDLCEVIETQSRNGNVENPEQQFAAVEQKLAVVQDILKGLL